MTRKGDPLVSTVKILIAAARGMCEFPDCQNELVVENKFVGVSAHIEAAEKGSRYNENLRLEQVRDLQNLILLCPYHHSIVDKNSEKYTVEELKKMKSTHEQKYHDLPNKISDYVIDQIVWKRQFLQFSMGTIQSIPQTIHGNSIPRNDHISKILDLMRNTDKIVITGDKGSGKSVLLCQLCTNLIENKEDVLFVRCDDFLGINNIDELNKILSEEKSLIQIINEIGDEKKLIVVFDSLDAISRNEKSMNLFKLFLKMLWGTSKVKTVCSVRSYDYDYSPSISRTDWGIVYQLSVLDESQLEIVLQSLGNPVISNELKKMLLNPLNLKLLSLILERAPTADFSQIKNEIELYDEHWKEYVERLDHATEVRDTLFSIALKMSTAQQVMIMCESFGNPTAMNEALSRNVIIRDESIDQISFFHHAYLDYVISRYIITKHPTFVDFLSNDQYNIFLRPTIIFALSMLNHKQPKKYVEIIEKILHSQLKYYWKISALTSICRIDNSSEQDFSNLKQFLSTDLVLQRHFLRELIKQKNNFWFELWADSLFTDISSKNANIGFLIEYLRTLKDSKQYHQSVFKILKLIVANFNNAWFNKRAIELSSDIEDPEKVNWLLNLSKSEDLYIRDGVIETLPRLIETDPDVVPEIFSNIYTYVERSDEKTSLPPYGTFTMMSNKKQDNRLIIWRAGKLFPKLLEKNPKQMILAAIQVFKTLKKDNLAKQKGQVIEDSGYVWFESSPNFHDESKLLMHIRKHLNKCAHEQLVEFIPIFRSTSLATFRAILLDVLVNNYQNFITEIFAEISNPEVYRILTMRYSLRKAINKIASLLPKEQIDVLLECVMNIQFDNRKLDEEDLKILNRIKAEFLSEFPKENLQEDHLEILNKFKESELKYEPPFKMEVEIGKEPEDRPAEPSFEETISQNLGKELDDRKKIELLGAISQYLDKKTEELDKSKFGAIKQLLIDNKDHADPEENSEDEDSSMIFVHNTVRGLVAKCMVQLLYHSKESDLIPIIEKFSEDPINIVRGEILHVFRYLVFYDYDLAYSIVKKYSLDPDPRIQFYLIHNLDSFAHKNPKHAIVLINNILQTLPSNYQEIQGIENFLIFLVFIKKEDEAIKLLDKILTERLFSKEIRGNIPFVLKEHYLFDEKYQDQSLDVLYKLLGDPEHEVREKASFFLLNSFDKDEKISNERFIGKIEMHLDSIANETDRRPWDPRIIEELVRFLEKYWELLPEKTVDYLEKIVREEILDYSAYQPVFADNIVQILTGIFQYPNLTIENRKRCLDVLDKFAMAGWEEALDLLSAMERPD